MILFMIRKILLLSFLISGSTLQAQDMLSQVEGKDSLNGKDFTVATFKTTRLINFHTLETVGRRTLDFRISHRFGAINSGADNAWGIDGPVNIRLGLEYSPDGRFMFGIGRTSIEKLIDGFLKYRLIRQTTDDQTPVSVTLFTGAYYTSQKNPLLTNGEKKFTYMSNRLAYNSQVMIGRKFSRSFSLQIGGWFSHYNLVDLITDKNDAFGASGIFRYKFTNRQAITFEYSHAFNDYSPANKYYDSMGVGYEIETGGHVFQVHLTNSFGLVESQYFTHTDTQWNDAGIRIGFNVSRVFWL